MTSKFLPVLVALSLLPALATPTIARPRAHTIADRSHSNPIEGRQIAAPPWSAACMTDHGPSECGEPIDADEEFTGVDIEVDSADPKSPQPSTQIAQGLGYATVGINMRGTGCSGWRVRLLRAAPVDRRLRRGRDDCRGSPRWIPDDCRYREAVDDPNISDEQRACG